MATAMRERWSDERLDDLNTKVDDGFRRMDERFTHMDNRFDAMQRTMVQCFVGLATAMVTGFVATLALLASR